MTGSMIGRGSEVNEVAKSPSHSFCELDDPVDGLDCSGVANSQPNDHWLISAVQATLCEVLILCDDGCLLLNRGSPDFGIVGLSESDLAQRRKRTCRSKEGRHSGPLF
jgi:hypothetical protein